MDESQALLQIDSLIVKGAAVGLRPPNEQYAIGPTRIQPQPFTEWRSQALSFLKSALPRDHTYIIEFEAATAPKEQNNPYVENREGGLGILMAFKDDLTRGYLVGLRRLIASEVFVDFLDMAEHLLKAGYHHAAASIAGAVLEDGLRRTLRERSLKATGNLESMNQLALDAKIYAPLVFKQIKVWIDIRNSADHGQWEKVESDRVNSFIRDLPRFLEVDLGPT